MLLLVQHQSKFKPLFCAHPITVSHLQIKMVLNHPTKIRLLILNKVINLEQLQREAIFDNNTIFSNTEKGRKGMLLLFILSVKFYSVFTRSSVCIAMILFFSAPQLKNSSKSWSGVLSSLNSVYWHRNPIKNRVSWFCLYRSKL